MKSLNDIAWNVDEPTYRADEALSYSTLSTYEREGQFEKLPTLFDKKESPSLVKGSALDTFLTDGEEAYENAFMVADFPPVSETLKPVIDTLFDNYGAEYVNITDIPNVIVIDMLNQIGYGKNWKEKTRLDKLYEAGLQYYQLKHLALGKTLITSDINNWVHVAADALRNSPATSKLFAKDNPFEPEIERLYQIKFKTTIEGIPYRCMFDLIYCDREKKIILPVDLKSSSKREYNFYKSFVEWGYMWQAKLYTRILREIISQDEYFKDFKILPYIFVVACNKGDKVIPLAWQFDESVHTEDFIYTDRFGIKHTYRSPLTIGKELWHYLHSECAVPEDINLDKPNNIIDWLKK